jgi:hypothetical protein
MEPIAPVASAASAAAARALPLGDTGLTIGQRVQARVTRADGNHVQLQWGDQTVNVGSRVPLTVGQQVTLMVEEGSGGKTLLRMVDDTVGKNRPARADTAGNGRAARQADPAGGGRQAPVTSRPGQAGNGRPDGRPFEGGGPERGATGTSGGRLVDGTAPGRVGGPAAPAARPWGATGQPPMRSAGALASGPWQPTQTAVPGGVVNGDALTNLLFEPLDGTAARLAGAARQGTSNGSSPAPGTGGPSGSGPPNTGRAGTPASTTPGGPPMGQGGQTSATDSTGAFAARTAIPTYGRLSQSVGGTTAFGLLLATLGHEAGRTLARAPLAPADLGRLLVDTGIHPDEMNTVLVSEMLAQGEAVTEASVRQLRRGLAAAGGSLADAAPAVALSRLGLPLAPLSLAVARQLLAGQFDPPAAWGELLGELQRLMRGGGATSQIGVLAQELLADWHVPIRDGADGIAQWLRSAVDQVATPLEAKLARTATLLGGENPALTTPGQDVRARLDLLGQVLALSPRGERSPLAHALHRTQATIQSEQILNGATVERSEPRFFAVTVPTIVEQRPSALELRVRERDARDSALRDVVRPDVVQIRLDLPSLGDLGVNLTIGQHSVACHFSAATPFAEALLTASTTELIGRLKRLGFSHTAIDAAHEAPEPIFPAPPATPRVGRVDAKA